MTPRVIESLLDNEAMTNGLTDAHAQRLIQWCLRRIEACGQPDESAMMAYGRKLAQRARTITRIVNDIQDGKAESHIQRGLERLTTAEAQRGDFIKRLHEGLTLDEAIGVLLQLAEGESDA